MECFVVEGGLVRIDVRNGMIFLKGEKEFRELRNKLRDVLFKLKNLNDGKKYDKKVSPVG